MNDSSDSKFQKFFPLLLGLTLALWGVLLAVGAFIPNDVLKMAQDNRKFWIVAGTALLFNSFWIGALLLNQKRMRKRAKITQQNSQNSLGEKQAGNEVSTSENNQSDESVNG